MAAFQEHDTRGFDFCCAFSYPAWHARFLVDIKVLVLAGASHTARGMHCAVGYTIDSSEVMKLPLREESTKRSRAPKGNHLLQ